MGRYKAGSAEERRAKYRKTRIAGEVIPRKLSYPEREGYVRRWRNDKNTRIQDLLDKGWDYVQKEEGVTPGDPGVQNEVGLDLGTCVSKHVGAEDDGRPIRAYLMEIKREWWEEDRKAKDKYLDDLEKNITEGGGVGGVEIERKYIPKSGGTKIERV